MSPSVSLCEPQALLKRYGWWQEEEMSKSREQWEPPADGRSSSRANRSRRDTTWTPIWLTQGGVISLCGAPEWLLGLQNVAGATEGFRKWDFTLTVMFIVGNDSSRKMMVTQTAGLSDIFNI